MSGRLRGSSKSTADGCSSGLIPFTPLRSPSFHRMLKRNGEVLATVFFLITGGGFARGQSAVESESASPRAEHTRPSPANVIDEMTTRTNVDGRKNVSSRYGRGAEHDQMKSVRIGGERLLLCEWHLCRSQK